MNNLSAWQRLKASFSASAGQVVFGMEDGTVSIFGLVFGVAATTTEQSAVLIAGASGAVAAAVSMMAGTYLDVETNRDQARVMASRIEADLQTGSTAVLERVTQRLSAAGLAPDNTAVVNRFLSSEPAVLKSFATALTGSAGADVYKSDHVNMQFQIDGQNLNNVLNVIDFGGLFSGNAIGPSRSLAMRLTTTF